MLYIILFVLACAYFYYLGREGRSNKKHFGVIYIYDDEGEPVCFLGIEDRKILTDVKDNEIVTMRIKLGSQD